MFFRHGLRQQRAAHRSVKRTNDAQKNHHGVDRIDRAHPRQNGEQQQAGADSKPNVAGDQQLAAVQAVRRVTRDQKQQNARQELRQTHQSQVERPLRDFVDLPADRNRLHLQARNNAKARQLVGRKVRKSEGHAPSA